MAQKQELMASGLPYEASKQIGFDTFTTIAAAGSGQTTATLPASNCVNVTSGSGGVIMPASTELFIGVNNSGGSITFYPPVGSAINGGSTNAGFTWTSTKGLFAIPVGLNVIVNLSA